MLEELFSSEISHRTWRPQMNIWCAPEEQLTLTYEEIKPNRMWLTNNSMLQFLSSPEMQFLNKIKAWRMMLEAPNIAKR